MIFNILVSQILGIFDEILKKSIWNLSFSEFIFMGQSNIFSVEFGLMDSFWSQWSGSEDIDIWSFSNISIKFALVFKFFV